MYELELVTPMPVPNYEAIVVGPKGNNMIRYKKRAPVNSEQIEIQMKLKEEHALSKLNSKQSLPSASTNNGELSTVEGQTVFTRDEIARHNTKDDLWIIVDNKVYDITNYVDIHQGGTEALVRVGGGEATKQIEGPQHPGTVKTLLERFLIGKVAPEIKISEINKHNKKGDSWIIINGKVYDVSKFSSNDYPGGEAALLKVAGNDATSDFERLTSDAKNQLAKSLIGIVSHS